MLHALLGFCAFLAGSLLGSINSSAHLAGILVLFSGCGYALSKISDTFVANLRGSWGLMLPILLFWTNPLWLEDTSVSFLIWGPTPVVGWVFGGMFKTGIRSRNRSLSAGFMALFLGFTAFAALWGQPRWVVFSNNLHLGPAPLSVASLQLSPPESNTESGQESGQSVALNTFTGKIQVFNFWSYSCGGCIAEFPWWEKAKQHYAHDANIQFNLVRWESDFKRDSLAKASNWHPERNTTLVPYVISDAEARKLGIAWVPHVWIVDAAGKTIFWGGLPYWESGFHQKLRRVLRSAGSGE